MAVKGATRIRAQGGPRPIPTSPTSSFSSPTSPPCPSPPPPCPPARPHPQTLTALPSQRQGLALDLGTSNALSTLIGHSPSESFPLSWPPVANFNFSITAHHTTSQVRPARPRTSHSKPRPPVDRPSHAARQLGAQPIGAARRRRRLFRKLRSTRKGTRPCRRLQLVSWAFLGCGSI